MKNLFRKLNLNLREQTKDRQTSLCMVCIILFSCLFTAILQGGNFFYTSHYTKVLVMTCILTAYTFLFLFLVLSHRMNERTFIFMLIFLGTLLRCNYVLMSGLYERQHDAGVFTGINTDFINPGHIGYIEYIYKFHKLPELNPYELFAYYHPPLHHIISYIWLQINIWLGVTEELAFENLQILPLLYSCLCMVVIWKILKTLEIEGLGLYIGLLFVFFHPATIIMAGSVNNDMLTILFMSLIILETLRWTRKKELSDLVRLALYIGFGMITKLNSAVLTIPIAIIFLMHIISVFQTKEKPLILKWIKNYCIFGAIVMPIGLSWILRNLIRFGEKPGVPVPGETSPMYTATYSLWDRLGIPSLASMHFDFPFHPISAKACNNTWAIMMHTSLFAEEYPTDLPDILLILCQITFILAVIFSIATAILLVMVLLARCTRLEDRIFLLFGYVIMLISFAAFVIIYPYTCSSDFRYVSICLVYIAIALGLGNHYYLNSDSTKQNNGPRKFTTVFMYIINSGILLILALLTVIYTFWNRW